MGELEEKETPQTETTATQETLGEPKETDKMLDKKDEAKEKTPSPQSSKPATPNAGKKSPTPQAEQQPTEAKSGEEIIDIPAENGSKSNGGAAGDSEEKKISKEEREVKPKKIPIGGLKLPGFFMKNKPKAEGDGAEGELLEKDKEQEQDEEKGANGDAAAKAEEAQKPRAGLGQRLRNFFVRKPAAEKDQKEQEKKQLSNGDADAKSEATAEAAPAEDGDVPTKRGLLNAIKLPIANMLPKKKSGDDVELGLGKAGLASMETLDDSLKDQDTVDRAPLKSNGADELKSELKDEKLAAEQKLAAEEEERERPVSLWCRLRGYKCSVDDALIVFGILLFLLLLGVIGYVLTHETLTSPPLREGRYISAVTSCGMVEGVKEDGAFAFRGIPYAKAPLDELRWQPAQLIDNIEDCWNGTLQTHNGSTVCTQRLGNGTTIGEENCLYLDVVTPHVRYTNPLPVVVLIGAESLVGPSPGILRPSARYSRSHDVIFVRPNFRLGVFGFLALDALTKDANPHSSGNYALSDIIAVLKWIQLNIVHFGGDAKSVTLLGHRAGATLVSALVTSKQLDGLYTRAWASSASAVYPGKALQESERMNTNLMATLDCQDAACLREASSEKLWAATPDTWFNFPVDLPKQQEQTNASRHEWLVLDGVILQQHPTESWKQATAAAATAVGSSQSQKPKLVMGATAHEAHTPKLRELHANWTAEEVREYLQASQLGAMGLTDEIIKRYNATNYAALVAIITDIRTVCPLIANVRLQPSVPMYVVTQGEGEDQLATVDADVQAILGRYEPHTVEQRRFVSAMQQLFYYYVSHGTVQSVDSRRRFIIVGQDAVGQLDHEHCNYWIDKDIVPRYARTD
ncbi:neurotactin [Drosophila sulfurigaster albostrigata]|uniref:neurotactin n=1 Tax=Drosophila sulfurigaster albostrigata TaxID=89887 RepID=UPI002D21A35D|nr:neurotactin [Drosophila sulfurigaster albostrigata]XP_062129567.1 neurotactin [Drosophila sulfurigaster albostrigata]